MIEPYYYRHSNFQNWFTRENSDPFTYVGCHYVDLIYFITGLKPVEVSVLLVEGEPGDGALAVGGPAGDERGLAETGRGADEGRGVDRALLQPVREVRTMEMARLRPRRAELRLVPSTLRTHEAPDPVHPTRCRF